MAIYSAGDKAIFDALNLPAVTNGHLRELFLSRGIIISKSTRRRELADYYSRLLHDYQDYQTLARLFGSPVRRERLSSLRVISDSIEISQFEQAAHRLSSSIEATGDVAKIMVRSNGSFDIIIKYHVTQFNQTEFRQVVAKEATITVEPVKGGVSIIGPHNDQVDEWTREILRDVGEDLDDSMDIDEVSLEHIADPSKRSAFFMQLINSINGFELQDVTDAFVYKPKFDDDDDVDLSIDLGVHISRASLKGEGVLQSEELRGLFDKGFYLWKVVWQSVKKVGKSGALSDLYEFEAQFSEPETCTRFSYLPRGVYKVQEDSGFNKSRTGLVGGEDISLGRLIEDAARSIVETL